MEVSLIKIKLCLHFLNNFEASVKSVPIHIPVLAMSAFGTKQTFSMHFY